MKEENQNSTSLNKYIASSGLCSRRAADDLIDKGEVTINGETARKGNRVEEGDEVKVSGKVISPKEKMIYLAYNKPKGIISTTDRRENYNIVDAVNHPERVYPIGRLDRDSHGLILLTNDGDIVNKILRSRYNHEKEYIVRVDKNITNEFIHKMSSGLPILDQITKPCRITQINKKVFKIILTQGLNRQIRRMCEFLGYEVKDLKRIRIMHLKLGDLQVGEWRNLTHSELNQLKVDTDYHIKTK